MKMECSLNREIPEPPRPKWKLLSFSPTLHAGRRALVVNRKDPPGALRLQRETPGRARIGLFSRKQVLLIKLSR